MATPYRTQAKVSIDAPQEKVWEALTRPEIIKQWFFGVDTVTEWKVGGPIVHRGEWKGKPYEDKGIILAFEPPKAMAHNHWSSLSGLPDRPENYQDVTYDITRRHHQTELTVTEHNIPNEDARIQSEAAWNKVLGALKDLVEYT
jgi:uncharacterized protein YndB with AHSA1/START domain